MIELNKTYNIDFIIETQRYDFLNATKANLNLDKDGEYYLFLECKDKHNNVKGLTLTFDNKKQVNEIVKNGKIKELFDLVTLIEYDEDEPF